jgi:hypothetical protein
MSEDNKHNILFFENSSMRGLHDAMERWQNENHKRFLSLSIQQDGETFCCIALTNPTEVVITNYGGGGNYAMVGNGGYLMVKTA